MACQVLQGFPASTPRPEPKALKRTLNPKPSTEPETLQGTLDPEPLKTNFNCERVI